MRLLKIAAANFLAGDLGGDCQHRRAAAMAIVKPVDEVHVPGPATSGTDRQLAGQMGLRSGGECGRFLVTHANPLDVLALADFLQQAIERNSLTGQSIFGSGGLGVGLSADAPNCMGAKRELFSTVISGTIVSCRWFAFAATCRFWRSCEMPSVIQRRHGGGAQENHLRHLEPLLRKTHTLCGPTADSLARRLRYGFACHLAHVQNLAAAGSGKRERVDEPRLPVIRGFCIPP
jgi:hypothetical protein